MQLSKKLTPCLILLGILIPLLLLAYYYEKREQRSDLYELITIGQIMNAEQYKKVGDLLKDCRSPEALQLVSIMAELNYTAFIANKSNGLIDVPQETQTKLENDLNALKAYYEKCKTVRHAP